MTRMNISELEDYISQIDAAEYGQRRNYLGGSTNLSEYITRGVISLPRVRDLLLKSNSPEAASTLLKELAWREYWQQVWQIRGDDIFSYFRPLPVEPRAGIPEAVLKAQTGIVALDKSIEQLQATGYIHNHERLWLAGLICNIAKCDWRLGAQWMHEQLIDGDYASNHLSWQWVAGSYTGKPYLPQQDNINSYTGTVQKNTYLDTSYEIITDMPIPEQLQSVCLELPRHVGMLPGSTVSIADLAVENEILLYSPWTLDPVWRSGSPAKKVILVDSEMFSAGSFSQNVIDSILWFTNQIPNLQIVYAQPADLVPLSQKIVRKSYPGISDWPGQVDKPELLYPNVPSKFYPSFSAFWKQAQKSERPSRVH